MKNISERLKILRKFLNLNQTEFGERIGVSRSVIKNLEIGAVEVKEHMLKLICSEFKTNETWLRTGQGEMFIEDDNVLLSQLAKQYNLDAFSRKFIEMYIGLPESVRNVIKESARALIPTLHDEEISAELTPAVGHTLSDADIDAEVESYRRELEHQKMLKENSSASGTIKEA